MVLKQDKEPLLEHERPSTIAAPRVLTPNIIVLLGSTSALTGLETMRHMLTLNAADQRKVAFVYIDTDDPPAPLVEFRRQHNNVFQEFPLRIAVPTGISNATPSTEKIQQHTFIREKVPQYFANGAGGIRNNGHVAASFNYQFIYDVLDRALMAVTRLNTDQNAAKVQEVQANIVAFLGGGTGSGILADIAVIVRDILMHRQYKQRLNLFCMLPEPISGASLNDLKWRKSNATASLLELLAYSRAAARDPIGGYEKYMRTRMHRLTNDPIANEVYLIGHASMDNAGETARIVGLDLFQRTTDASGVGFLEHSKWVDRRTLGAEDDRHLPTMFGTSCPLEVRFPAEETATAFAQIATANVLPLLASYQPVPVPVGDVEKREWRREWANVARSDANMSDPFSIKIAEFRAEDFEDAALAQLDLLWSKVDRYERQTEARIKEIIDDKVHTEQNLIRETPVQAVQANSGSLINQRIQYLKLLQQKYTFLLNDLRDRPTPRTPGRPSDLETKLIRQPQWPGPLRKITRDYASAVCEAYNDCLRQHARATRHRFLEQALTTLNDRVNEALNQSMAWFRTAGAEVRAKELYEKGLGSMAWHGKLEYPHPHQRHIFDLQTLRTQDERNVAVERLYLWVSGGEQALDEQRVDFKRFIEPCVEYLTRRSSISGDNLMSIDKQAAGRLADRVKDFFHDYYMSQFADTNLFELLTRAAPQPRSGQSRTEQVSQYLQEHLAHMRGLMSSLIAFEPELWQEGASTLDTSVYLGIHWRDGSQEFLLEHTLNSLGALTRHGQTPFINKSNDPHRLQIAYGQHAISLSTIRDYYLEKNSAMEYYMEYQKAWDDSNGTGLMPVHSSGEAERLVTQPDALVYNVPLVELVIRRPFSRNTAGANGNPHNMQPPPPNYGSGPDSYDL